jgi:hypothetical protein
MTKFVLWIDDDEALIEPERYDLEVMGVEPKVFALPSSALDWIINNRTGAEAASAIVVDALLPRCEDVRFKSSAGIPSGVVLCEALSKVEFWDILKPKVRLYTRLPDDDRYNQIAEAARHLGLQVFRKTITSRLALWLQEDGLI